MCIVETEKYNSSERKHPEEIKITPIADDSSLHFPEEENLPSGVEQS